jgi:hypothetical protein
MGVWLLVIAGGLAIAWYARTRTAAAPAAGTPTATTGNTAFGSGPGAGDTQLGNGAGPVYGPDTTSAGGTPTPTQPAIQTNDDWYRQALTQLVAKGYDANTVDSALRDYLNGVALNATESAIKAVALTMVGPPPVTPAPAPGTALGGGTTGGPHVATQDVTINVGHMQTVSAVIAEANALGYPMSWADFWSWNPDAQSKYGLLQVNAAGKWDPSGTWTFTSWSAPVVIQKAGSIEDQKIGGDAPH